MTNQLPDIYNEAFLVGWKALFTWPETEEIPLQPSRESLPYPDAPIGVLEEEVQEPMPQPPDEGEDAPPSDWRLNFLFCFLYILCKFFFNKRNAMYNL